MVSNPSIVKHPKSNQYFMFYTMRLPQPVKKEIVDKRTGKKTTVTERPSNAIGVAYATSCDNSPDGSGLCWTDVSKDRPLIQDKGDMKGGEAPSAFMEGSKVILYYKRNAPQSALVRAQIDIRDWKIERMTPLTFQIFDVHRKKWEKSRESMQTAISDIDVKPYGKGYMMVGNDASENMISRWKSSNGVNFYYDPYDGNTGIIGGKMDEVGDPYLEPVSDNQFRVYYTLGDATSECSQSREAHGTHTPCRRAVQVRLMSEEKNPKIYENYYFDEGYTAPEYNYERNPPKEETGEEDATKKAKDPKSGFFNRLFD